MESKFTLGTTNTARRFLQIFYICEAGIFLGLVQHWFFGSGALYVPLVIAMFALLPVVILIRAGYPNLAGGYLLLGVLALIFYVTWKGAGLRDEVLMALPAVIIFSVLISDFRIFILISMTAIANVLVIGVAVSQGAVSFAPAESSVSSVVLLTLIIGIVSFSAWLVDRDLRRAYSQLTEENKQVQAKNRQIQNLIFYDTLTGLPNRALALDRCNHAIEQSRRTGNGMAVIFLDLDDFKGINDNFGHQVGDKYLKRIADGLKDAIRAEDTVCRLGGDEFLILVERVKDKEEVSLVAEKLLQKVSDPIVIEDVDHRGSCSLGIAIYPDDGEDFDTLCNCADQAMYKSKGIGKNHYSFFDQQVDTASRDRLALLADLRFAIEKKQLQLYYQPQIRVSDEKIIGAEALLRWNHPERGMIGPNVFIPMAESCGLIHELGDWVLGKVAEHVNIWHEMGFEELRVAVNVSPLQLEKGDFAKRLKSHFNISSVVARTLEIEFTESFIMKDAEKFKLTMSELREQGINLAIDDFGTGYSNLGYINRFEVGTLKIDQSFIRHIHEDEKARLVVEAVVHLARSLSMETVAEGVETEEIYQVLKEIGCDVAQGYLWSRPLPPSEFKDFYLDYTGAAEDA